MVAIDPRLRIGSVKLAVSDLPRSVEFYERVLGLPLIGRDEHRRAARPRPPSTRRSCSSDIAAPTPLPPGATGLYHVAWLHPSRAALAESVRRVAGARWPFEGASDHGVSEALYLSDPDGLGHRAVCRPPARAMGASRRRPWRAHGHDAARPR